MTSAVNPMDGVRIHYEVEGQGPPLVLFHGSGVSLESWRAAGYADALKGDYRLVLLDARGHGKSDKPHAEDDFAMERFAGDVLAVLDDAGIERAHYFGYSLGGRVGFGLGKYAPERFLSMVLGGSSYHMQPGDFDRLFFTGALAILSEHGIPAFLEALEERLGRTVPPVIRASYQAADGAALAPYLRRMEYEPSFEDAFPKMTMPVLLYAGERDAARLESSRYAASQLPDATFVAIDGEDHPGAFTNRAKVLPYVTTFLDQVAARQPAGV